MNISIQETKVQLIYPKQESLLALVDAYVLSATGKKTRSKKTKAAAALYAAVPDVFTWYQQIVEETVDQHVGMITRDTFQAKKRALRAHLVKFEMALEEVVKAGIISEKRLYDICDDRTIKQEVERMYDVCAENYQFYGPNGLSCELKDFDVYKGLVYDLQRDTIDLLVGFLNENHSYLNASLPFRVEYLKAGSPVFHSSIDSFGSGDIRERKEVIPSIDQDVVLKMRQDADTYVQYFAAIARIPDALSTIKKRTSMTNSKEVHAVLSLLDLLSLSALG